jgi:hypothetical protein
MRINSNAYKLIYHYNYKEFSCGRGGRTVPRTTIPDWYQFENKGKKTPNCKRPVL